MESVLLFYSIGVQFVYDSGVYPVKPFFVFCFSGAYLTGAVQIYSLNINYIASYLLIYGRPAGFPLKREKYLTIFPDTVIHNYNTIKEHFK